MEEQPLAIGSRDVALKYGDELAICRTVGARMVRHGIATRSLSSRKPSRECSKLQRTRVGRKRHMLCGVLPNVNNFFSDRPCLVYGVGDAWSGSHSERTFTATNLPSRRIRLQRPRFHSPHRRRWPRAAAGGCRCPRRSVSRYASRGETRLAWRETIAQRVKSSPSVPSLAAIRLRCVRTV